MGRKNRIGEDRRIIPTGSDPDSVRRNSARRTTIATLSRLACAISPQTVETYRISRREYASRLSVESDPAHPFSDGVPVRTFTQCQNDHTARMAALTAHYERFPAFRPLPGRPPFTSTSTPSE